jgi:prepilin-type N-terminal cleavage/methylation domain-containing protein
MVELARSNTLVPFKEFAMPRNRKGFTLIELLIVVVIIGILAAIAIPKFANTKANAFAALMKSDLRNLITAQEACFSDFNSMYASSTANLGTNYAASPGITVRLGSVTGPGLCTRTGASRHHYRAGHQGA